MGMKYGYPEFDSVENCPKCGQRPQHTKNYIKKDNLIRRFCVCGYSWKEVCKDGEPPTDFVFAPSIDSNFINKLQVAIIQANAIFDENRHLMSNNHREQVMKPIYKLLEKVDNEVLPSTSIPNLLADAINESQSIFMTIRNKFNITEMYRILKPLDDLLNEITVNKTKATLIPVNQNPNHPFPKTINVIYGTTMDKMAVRELLKKHMENISKAMKKIKDTNMPGDFFSMKWEPLGEVYSEFRKDIDRLGDEVDASLGVRHGWISYEEYQKYLKK